MNQKQLAYLQSILTSEQLKTFSELKKPRIQTAKPPKEKQEKVKCQASKKDKTTCKYNASSGERYCGIHLKTLEKVSLELADAVILSATT